MGWMFWDIFCYYCYYYFKLDTAAIYQASGAMAVLTWGKDIVGRKKISMWNLGLVSLTSRKVGKFSTDQKTVVEKYEFLQESLPK